MGVGKAPPAQWKMGDVAVKCDPASLWLGCFAQQVAADLEPGSKGLGRHNPTVIQPRAPAVAPKEWTGAAAALWRRMASNLAGGRGAPPPHTAKRLEGSWASQDMSYCCACSACFNSVFLSYVCCATICVHLATKLLKSEWHRHHETPYPPSLCWGAFASGYAGVGIYCFL